MSARVLCFAILLSFAAIAAADDSPPPSPAQLSPFQPLDVFDLEWATEPQVSPDGERVVYVRSSFDVMTDRRRSALWVVSADGSRHRPLAGVSGDASSPRWSPDGSRILYLADREGSKQIHVHWSDTGQSATLTRLTAEPGNPVWSPDGRWIAFTMPVAESPKPLAKMPDKPEGASWAPEARVIEDLVYRADGSGYLAPEYHQIFLLPAEGGTPRQLTFGPYHHRDAPAFSADGKYLIFAANRHPDGEHDPLNTEIYELEIASGEVRPLTRRQGPDNDPAVSPDGKKIAYLGFDDRYQGYQVTGLWVMEQDGSNPRLLTGELDRSVSAPAWSADGRGIYFLYDDYGVGKIGYVPAAGGAVVAVAENVGGTSLGRPYGGGDLSAEGGLLAFTVTGPHHPADVAVARRGGGTTRLTRLNDDLLAHRRLGEVEEIRFASSKDGREIQGWLVKPPGFDPGKKYPLILEIHGGPFANYGPRFAAEIQLYAAAGYVVLYVNPRGSTSYGGEFGNLIHHAYPGDDYFDLVSGIDAAIARGYVDPERLYVTGGSGGGVLTAWIVGRTDRFRAAAVQKPVIHWTSFALTADAYNFFYRYWFPGFPWEHPEHYWERSPLALVGNVSTPTLVITGEADYRTPISESEQYYQALKLRRVPAALVRIPEASHGIARRPSHLIAKVAHILAWFERYSGSDGQ